MSHEYYYEAFESVGGPGVSRQTIENRYKIISDVESKHVDELTRVLERNSQTEGGAELQIPILRDLVSKLSLRRQSAQRFREESIHLRESRVRQTAEMERVQTNSVELDSKQRPGFLHTCMDICFVDVLVTFTVYSSAAPLTVSGAITKLRNANYDYSFWSEASEIIPHDLMPEVPTCRKRALYIPVKFLDEVRPPVRMLELNEVKLEATRQFPVREHVTSLFNNRCGPHDKWFSGDGRLEQSIFINVAILGEPKQVLGYMLQVANDTTTHRDPKSWVLRGRPATENREWMVLHEMANFDQFRGRWECARFDLAANLPKMEALQLEIREVRVNNGRGAELGQFRILVTKQPGDESQISQKSTLEAIVSSGVL